MALLRDRLCKLVISSLCKRFSSSASAAPQLTFVRRLSSMDETEKSNFSDTHQNPPEPIPNRPLRGERPFSPKDSPSSKPNSRSTNGGNSNQFENFKDVGGPDNAEKRSMKASPFDFSRRGDDLQSDDMSFLEKFKLGTDKREKQQQQPLQDDNGKSDHVESKGSPPDANDIFGKMKETGLIPNAVAMLDGLCKDGLVQEAMKLFELMREKGTIPEVVIYTAVVEGFLQARKPDDAKRIFRKMQNNGIAPNAFSYSVLIQGLYKCEKLEDAIEFTLEMSEAGYSPNVATFVGLVDGICREKGVEDAKTFINDLRKKGFFLNEKSVRDFLEKKAPFSPPVWEAIFGKKTPQKPF